MKILVVGAGLSGCSAARLLKDRGHEVSLIEKRGEVGGLCITRTGDDELRYEPFGARTFHAKSSRVREFVARFDDFNGYVHRKGMIINGRLFPFPMTKAAIDGLEEKERIFEELKNRPAIIDKTNFETACISIFGRTLYGYFVKNYTVKMWGVDPKELTAEWAQKRLELREDDSEGLFKDEWQGLPCHGYSFLLERMIDGIHVMVNTTSFDPAGYDVVILSAPIDHAMDFKFGRLQYRGLRFDYSKDEEWEDDDYGTINLPQHPRYIRKCNFKILHKQKSSHSLVQYQEPVAADEKSVPMYPVNTEENNRIFDRYLKKVCATKNICPIGRLGLFKYLNMDKAVEVAFDMVAIIESCSEITSEERYKKIKAIAKSH